MLGFYGGKRIAAPIASAASISTYVQIDGATMVTIELPLTTTVTHGLNNYIY